MFVEVEMNVVIPSGILCNIKTITEMMPSLYSLFEVNFSSILSSIVAENKMPITIKIEHIRINGNILKMLLKRIIDSGISDAMEIVNITPAENESE